MDVTKDAANEALEQIEDTTQRAKRMVESVGGDLIFIAWGLAWTAGYLCTHFSQRYANWVWFVVVPAAGLFTVYMARKHSAVRPTGKSKGDGWRVFWFWWALFGYVGAWIVLLSPFIKIESAEQAELFNTHMGALHASMPMFAFVVMGLWMRNFMVWVGLALTGLILLGVFLFQPYFWLWMAIVGGGSLIGTGLFIRFWWR